MRKVMDYVIPTIGMAVFMWMSILTLWNYITIGD